MSAASEEAANRAAPRPILGPLAVVLTLGFGGYGAFFWSARDRGPAPELFPQAAQVIRDGWRRGDLIFLVPFYATRAREHLGDLHPLAVRDPLLEDLAVHPRAWVFGLFGEAEALRPRLLAAGMKLVKSDLSVPGITVDLWETGARSEVRWSFLENLRGARVFHEKDGARTACGEWTDTNGQGGRPELPGDPGRVLGRWVCPYDREWFYVAPEWHRMGDELRLCLWAHPPNEGRLVIEYPAVPMTGELHGRGGHTLNGSLNARAEVNLDVEVRGSSPARFSFALAEHFRPFALVTPGVGTATVTFGVSSPDAGANHFCFVADMRAPRDAPR